MLQIPGSEAYDGMICHVSKIENDSAAIDGVVYQIKHEYFKDINEESGSVYSYISLIKEGGVVKVGSDRFFDDTITVYGRSGSGVTYNVQEKPNGYEVKAYILEDKDIQFMCQEDEEGYYSIDSFQILDNTNDELSNYFKITNSSYYNRLSNSSTTEDDGVVWSEGWRRLPITDKDYLKVNTIHNYYEGNNPHNGAMNYDSGHEYFTYFKRIFKHANDDYLFDERCFEDYFNTIDNEIPYIGFSGLIEDDESIVQYDNFIHDDTKIHYFGNYIRKSEDGNKRFIYGDNCERIENFKKFYQDQGITKYNLSADTESGWIEKYNPYSERSEEGVVDEVTNQIMNNKRFKIIFYLHEDWYKKEGQEELKYLDDIVGNYLTQLIPSTTIYEVEYVSPKQGQ